VGRREVQAATGQQRQVEFGWGQEVFEVDGLVIRRLQGGQVFLGQRDALFGTVGAKTRSPPVAAGEGPYTTERR